MNWTDEAILLSAQAFGEGAALVQVFAREHGRAAGIVHGRRRQMAVLQPGTRVRVTWRARLDEQLGTFTVEPLNGLPAGVLASGGALLALQSLAALVLTTLPARDAHPGLYEGLSLLLAHLGEETVWPALLVRWEVGLLAELGFGLELNVCALTGSYEDLAYVSPKTGRAASRAAAAPYAGRLLPLPRFLTEGQGLAAPDWQAVLDGLDLTGHFLAARVFAAHHAGLPEARRRLRDHVARLARAGETA